MMKKAVVLTGVVVLKRMKAKSYPNTLKGVISQDGQYATWIENQLDIVPDERCIEIAEELLRFDLADDYPDNLVFQAEFKQGKKVYRKYGNEYFCLA